MISSSSHNEPFLASLCDDSQSFVKPRDKNSYLKSTTTHQHPFYQNIPVYIPPPEYGIPVPVSPTPSPSPYSEQENDPLYGLRKFHGQIYGKSSLDHQMSLDPNYNPYEINKDDELSKILQKDLALSQALAMDDRMMDNSGYNLNMTQVDDTGLLDYMTPTTDTLPTLPPSYRGPQEYYTLNDVANLCGIPADPAYQQPPPVHPTYPNYNEGYMQYSATGMMDMATPDKKLSPIEQAFQASWNQAHMLETSSPYTLSDKDDYNIASYTLLDQPQLLDTQQARGFPPMELQTENTIPNLRGRKNSSFREWNPNTDNKDTRLPPALAGQIEAQFTDKLDHEVDIMSTVDHITPGCLPPDQMIGPEYQQLTTLTAPQQPPQEPPASSSDPEALNKVRSVFMSFVDQTDDNINSMDYATKHQMFVDVCNVYKSLSVINIAENLQQGKKSAEEQHHMESDNPGNKPPNKRYRLRRTKADYASKGMTPVIDPTADPMARITRRSTPAAAVAAPAVMSDEMVDGGYGKGGNTCTFCGKTFPSNSSLKVHMNLHTGEKPHVCEFCNRGFGDPSNLKRHLRIHTRSRPYLCHICPTSFNQSSHLVRHLRSHSQRGCHKSCRFCLATFPHYSNLRQHTERCPERKKRGVPISPGDKLDVDQYYEDAPAPAEPSPLTAHPPQNMKYDMNFVLGGQGIETEPFINISPVEISGQCDEGYMRLMSMKQSQKVLNDNIVFGMKHGSDGSDISV